jgi:hypothetical protein
MKLKDKTFWNKQKEFYIKNVDCAKDWLLFFYFVFLFPVLCLWKEISHFIKDKSGQIIILFFLIGILYGYIIVWQNISRYFIIGFNLIVMLCLFAFNIFTNKDFDLISIIFILFFEIGAFLGGYFVGSRFNYVIWQYKYFQTEGDSIQNRFLLFKIRKFPVNVLFYLLPMLLSPIIIRITIERAGLTGRNLFYSFLIIFLIFYFIFVMSTKSLYPSDLSSKHKFK